MKSHAHALTNASLTAQRRSPRGIKLLPIQKLHICIFKSTKSKCTCREKRQFHRIISFLLAYILCVSPPVCLYYQAFCYWRCVFGPESGYFSFCSFSLVPMIYYCSNLWLSEFQTRPWLREGSPGLERTISPHITTNLLLSAYFQNGLEISISIIYLFFSPQWYKTSKVFHFFLLSLQCAEKAVSFMLLYLMLHKLAYIVHLFEMKGRNRWALNGLVSLNRPPSPPDYWRLWSIASTWANNRKHQISRPVESTFGFVLRGPT